MAELTQAQLDSLLAPQQTRKLSASQLQSLAPTGGSSVDQEALADFQSRGAAALRGAGQGVSLRTSDEMTGVLGGLAAARWGRNPIDGYTGARDRARAANSAAQEAFPTSYGGGEVLGGFGTALVSAPAAAGKTAFRTGMKALGIGATEGAIAGAGGSDGGDLMKDTAIGAGIGAGIGLAAHPLAQLVRLGARTAAGPVRGVMGESPTIANRTIQRSMDRAGMTQGDLQRAMMEAQADGQDMFTIADALGNSGQRTLSGVARQPGAGRQEIVDYLNDRQLGQSERVSSFLADALEAPDTATQRRSALTSQRASDADANYSSAREGAAPVDVRGALGVIDRRLAPFEGSGVVGDGIDAKFAQYRNRLAADMVPSDVDAIELSDFERVLGIKQDLSDDISVAQKAGRNNEARMLLALQKELDAALETSSDGYRAANDTFAQQSRVIDAIEQGQNAARPSVRGSDTVDRFNALSPDEQGAFRSGYADSRLTAVERAAPGVNVARGLESPKVGTELSAIAVNPDMLRRQIGRENTMFETRRQAIGGSQTADNLADQEDVMNIDTGVLANLLTGRWGAAGGQAAQIATNAARGTNEQTRTAIAKILLSRDPEKALASVVQRAQRDGNQQSILSALLRRPATAQSIELAQ